IHVCREKVREEKKIEVARNLVKEGISVDIILQTTGLSNYMIEKFL
ncbi:MAG: transcriptional regulator, partial [Wolbachia sp.]